MYTKQSPRQKIQTVTKHTMRRVISLWLMILLVNWYYQLMIFEHISSSTSTTLLSSNEEILSSSSASFMLFSEFGILSHGVDERSFEDEWRMRYFRKLWWCVALDPESDQETIRISIKKFQSFWIETSRRAVRIAVTGTTRANQMYFPVSYAEPLASLV